MRDNKEAQKGRFALACLLAIWLSAWLLPALLAWDLRVFVGRREGSKEEGGVVRVVRVFGARG